MKKVLLFQTFIIVCLILLGKKAFKPTITNCDMSKQLSYIQSCLDGLNTIHVLNNENVQMCYNMGNSTSLRDSDE